jgi:hypothetical protein
MSGFMAFMECLPVESVPDGAQQQSELKLDFGYQGGNLIDQILTA